MTDVIAVALSNILAHEEIQKHKDEEALKVALMDSLNQESNWEGKLFGVVKALRPHFPFHVISFGMIHPSAENHHYSFEQVAFDEYRALDFPAFLKMIRMDEKVYLREIGKEPYQAATIQEGEAFLEATQHHLVQHAMHQVFGIQSIMVIPLILRNGCLIYIRLYSKQTAAFNSSHRHLFESLLPSFTLALEKQLNYDEIQRLNNQLHQEKEYLSEEINVQYNFKEIIGSSQAMQRVFQKTNQVTGSDTTVLILGETGTGKELIARAIHQLSKRKTQSLIKVNCAALPSTLIESELFGHEKGAFTGALQMRIGKFELAHQGTIFLDEIGELPPEMQAKLLRVVQEKEFERVGGNRVIKTDVRIIAATNRQLELEIAQGNFRADLYYRLNVFPIELPPLRQRKEDIPELAIYFMHKHAKKLGKRFAGISDQSLQSLMSYDWPGNIRELEHCIEHGAIISNDRMLDTYLQPRANGTGSNLPTPNSLFSVKTFREAESEVILYTLRLCGGKVSGSGGAAELLDLNSATLESKMRKLGIKREHVIKKPNR